MDDRGVAAGLAVSEERTLGALVDSLFGHGGRTAIAAVREDGVEGWTYGELSDGVRRLAGGLCRAGVERGDHVAMFAGNSPEWIVACLAVVRAGAVVVPVDAQLGEAALGAILEDSGARFVFTTSEGAGRLGREEGLRPILLDAAEDDGRGWRCLLEDEDVELPRVGPEDPAALFYTSGTTGTAKGVPLSHGNLTFQLDTLLEANLVTEDDRVLLP